VEGREGKGRRVPPLDLNPGDATVGEVTHVRSNWQSNLQFLN